MSLLAQFFSPRSLAILGVSDRTGSDGLLLLQSLIEAGYSGDLVPVGNPLSGGAVPGQQILGKMVYPNARGLRREVEVALVCVPPSDCLACVQELATLHPKRVIVMYDPLQIEPEKHRALSAELADLGRRSEFQLVGPGSAGLYSSAEPFPACLLLRGVRPARGKLALVSSSYAYSDLLMRHVLARGIGISRFISLGTQAGLTYADFLKELATDDRTGAIAVCLEDMANGARFMEAAGEVSLRKPIILWSVGASDAEDPSTRPRGRSGLAPRRKPARDTRTAAAGPGPEVVRAAMRQCGVLQSEDLEGFLETAHVLSLLGSTLPGNDQVALISNQIEPALTASAELRRFGLQPLGADERERKKLKGNLPLGAQNGSLAFLPAGVDLQVLTDWVAGFLSSSPAGGGVVAYSGPDREDLAAALARVHRKWSKPMVFSVGTCPKMQAHLSQSGLPVFGVPERAVRAYGALVGYRRLQEVQRRRGLVMRPAAPRPAEPPGEETRPRWVFGLLPAQKLRQLLRQSGFSVPAELPIRSFGDAKRFARKNKFPLRLRAHADGLIDPDRRLPSAQVADLRELRKAFPQLRRRSRKHPVTVEKVVTGGCPMLLRVSLEGSFGSVLRFGIAGVLSELAGDVAVRVCPIRRADAEAMLGEIRGARLLEDHSAKTPPKQAVVDLLLKVSEFALAHPEIESLTLHPVLVRGSVIIPEAEALVHEVIAKPARQRSDRDRSGQAKRRHR